MTVSIIKDHTISSYEYQKKHIDINGLGGRLLAETGYQVTFVNKQEANGFKPEKVYLFSIEDRDGVGQRRL